MLANFILSLVFIPLIKAIDESNELKIKELEIEKHNLFKQINKAIDESVRSLQKSNDSDALIGLKYMSDLKERLNEVNETVVDENLQNGANVSDISSRRKLRYSNKKSDLFDFESIIKPKKIKPKDWKEMMLDREKMQKKLDEWILKRQEEKERQLKYRIYKKGLISSGKFEKCPRFGYQGKKKKTPKDKSKLIDCKEMIGDSNLNEDYIKCMNITKPPMQTTNIYDNIKSAVARRNLKKNKYPCCRKCCKKSYMGCL